MSYCFDLKKGRLTTKEAFKGEPGSTEKTMGPNLEEALFLHNNKGSPPRKGALQIIGPYSFDLTMVEAFLFRPNT